MPGSSVTDAATTVQRRCCKAPRGKRVHSTIQISEPIAGTWYAVTYETRQQHQLYMQGQQWDDLPWSMYLLTTLLISCLNLSVISVFLGFSICPITLMMSWPPAGRALALSRSCRVTSWTISLRLCTSPCCPATAAARDTSVCWCGCT